MLVRTTRFLLLILIASACLFTLSGKAFAVSETENVANIDAIAPSNLHSAQQSSEQVIQTSSSSSNESIQTVTHEVSQIGSTNVDSDDSINSASSANSIGIPQLDTVATSDIHSTNNGVSSKIESSKLDQVKTGFNIFSSSMYNYQENFSSELSSATDSMPVTLQSSATQGSLPIPTNLPTDGTGLVLHMLAVVFHTSQNAIVNLASVLNVFAQATTPSTLLFSLEFAIITLAITLLLLSLLLRSWRKNGFAHAARSDVDSLNMVFAATKRGFAYCFASSFFVTANIKNKIIIIT